MLTESYVKVGPCGAVSGNDKRGRSDPGKLGEINCPPFWEIFSYTFNVVSFFLGVCRGLGFGSIPMR